MMPVTYKDVVTVAPRFTRAVNVERDLRVASAVEGYVVTSTGRAVLARLARSLHAPAGHRAWTLTGPYGSGKSAFAVYLANLLGPAKTSGGRLARELLSVSSEPLFSEFFDRRKTGSLPAQGFCPIVVCGAAEPFLPALLRACARDIRAYHAQGRRPAALKRIEQLHKRAVAGGSVSSSELIDLLLTVTQGLQRSRRSQGILLIVDELGKFLEFAARDPENNDIHVLQQLAEATAQTRVPGFFLITILHQSFERYAAGLRPSVRDEWSKVQGRFEDVAFQESAEEFLELLAHAITHAESPLVRELRQRARKHAEKAFALDVAPRGLGKAEFIRAMQRCAPLHPLTVLVLARLCRKFGQNQRSLFSFLVSRETNGFSSFLGHEVSDVPFYGLDRLYDYVSQTLGTGLSVGEGATRWAEVEGALERCLAAPPDELQIIKTVGILSAIGTYGQLKASREVVEFAGGAEPARFKHSAEKLLKRSVLVHRKHSSSYALWQGSDVNIDEQLAQGKRNVPQAISIAQKLAGLWTPRPLVAKRHSAQTGTLRYFSVRFVDASGLKQTIALDADADGLLLYALPNSAGESAELVELAMGSGLRDRADVLLAIPKDIEVLREAVRELELLRWVEDHTPELQGDVVARREVRARIVVAEEHLESELRSLFSPTGPAARRTVWFHRGIPQQIPTSRSLSHLLSDICDVVYSHTPRLHNELLNRRLLSSAAAAARRNLIDAMITHGTEERLGIAGTPPEMSMYVSVIAATGVHRLEESGYAFGSPNRESGLGEVWNTIEKFFASCELERHSVVELFSLLQKPPFGLKMGVIPVLFCAAALAHDTEIAMYESSAFVPELSVELFERLLRSPEKFDLRRYRVAGVRREVFNQFAALLGTPLQTSEESLIAVVRPLFRFFNRLPQFTKQTKRLSEIALRVREALFTARDPDILLFEELPRACEIAPFLSIATDNTASTDDVPVFFQNLRKALSELQRAYDDLLSDLQQVLLRVFGITGGKGREVIRFRAHTLADHALEPRLRAFIHHLADEELEDVAWIEAIATLLVGKPPRTWTDTDRARYELVLSELARNFRHIEALAGELSHRAQVGAAPGEFMRIGVTDRFSKELEAVVVVEPHNQSAVAEAVLRIEEVLAGLQVGNMPSLALAALATASRRFLAEMEGQVGTPQLKQEEVSRE